MSAPRGVVVSGGTGALGRAVVHRFLAAGDRVVVPWIDEAEAKTLEQTESAAGERLVLVRADVAEEAGARLVAEAVAASGGATVLVNGVGGFAGGDPVHETPLEVWDRLYRMNLRSAVALSRALLPAFCAAGHGVVVNVSSQAVGRRPPGLAAYAASKAGVAVLTETLHAEVGPLGVRAVAIAPDTIDTPANRRAMPDADASRWTAPDAIAKVVFWLAGDDAASLGGAIVPV